jgi:ribulose-phosphate 3-epimerase
MSKLIAPSILSADFGRLAEEVRAAEKAGADWIHADVMDGHFVPNITFGPLVVKAVRAVTDLPIDVHLMIESPDRFIEDFAAAGADWISVHVETCPHLNRTLQRIHETGLRAGVVLNPSTPLAAVDWVLEYVDYLLVMSVNPGFGGQKFIPNSLQKVRDLRLRLGERNLPALIEIDGGVNDATIGDLAAAGADVFVAGSAIFGQSDYRRVIEGFRKRISAC